MRILVVDDDKEIAEFIRIAATAEGHEVFTVERGGDAIAAALTEDYDLLITDLMLPDFNGAEVVRALKAQAPQLPVIVVSALDPDEHQAEVEEAGASRYFHKPLRMDELRDEIRLVAMARAGLHVILIEVDAIHRIRLGKTLESLGCTVEAFADAMSGMQRLETGSETKVSLVMMEAALPEVKDILKWASTRSIPTFVFAEESEGAREDEFMRSGASLFLTKPINTDALLTQAQFLAHF